jgi:hypothetical protein
MLHFKPEARIHFVTSELMCILSNASMWSNKTGIGVEINSIDDGTHGAATGHGLSLAADIDTDGDDPKDLERLFQYMLMFMPTTYTVIKESDHIHVEAH